MLVVYSSTNIQRNKQRIIKRRQLENNNLKRLKKIVKHIEFEEDGFTDGMYEGNNPGNQGVYPSKYDEDEELGLIRIDLATISVVKKKFSSTKTKPKTDRRRPIRQKSAKKSN